MINIFELPAVATPWTDEKGVIWCATRDDNSFKIYRKQKGIWFFDMYVEIPAPLLERVGRSLPPLPEPKRVAKAVKVKDTDHEYAVVNGRTFYRYGSGQTWAQLPFGAQIGATDANRIIALADAHKESGDVLPY